MHIETLWNGYTLSQPDCRFRLNTDSVVCADFAGFAPNSNIADLGCGSGILSIAALCLGASSAIAVGIEAIKRLIAADKAKGV